MGSPACGKRRHAAAARDRAACEKCFASYTPRRSTSHTPLHTPQSGLLEVETRRCAMREKRGCRRARRVIHYLRLRVCRVIRACERPKGTAHRLCIRLGKRLNPPQHHGKCSYGSPFGWPVACHECLAWMTPTGMAYGPIIYFSRAASYGACASGRFRPCSQRRPVGGPRAARFSGKRPIPTRSGTRVTVPSSARGGSRRDAREQPRTAPAARYPRDVTV